MRLAIVGNGLLGRTLFEQRVEDPDASTVLLGHDDIDLTSHSSIRAALDLRRPDVVINTAAIHSLVECERDPIRAFDVNANGAGMLAKLVPTVYISTDYVFTDGGPHDESVPGGHPRSVYGRSKLAGELVTLEHGGIVVRVAGLFGHYRSHKGPTFPEMLLSSHDPIRLPTDQRFNPTYAPDAAEQILSLAAHMVEYPGYACEGIYHAVNRGPTSWAEFGEHILGYTGHDRHILPAKARDAIRPTDSSLRNTRLPTARHWAQALGDWARREQIAPPYVSPKRV